MSANYLDLTKNLSYFTVPVVFLICLLPHTYAAVTASLKVFDNAQPRAFHEAIAKTESLDKRTKQHILRAEAASANGFETLGLYAAAVVAGNTAGLETRILNIATIGYVLSRLAFLYAYIVLGENRKLANLRSAIWFSGIGCIVTLFVKAGYAVSK